MTDNEHIHPKLKVQRITPKSEFLKELERNNRYKVIENEILPLLDSYINSPMVDVYTGSDLNHLRGSE